MARVYLVEIHTTVNGKTKYTERTLLTKTGALNTAKKYSLKPDTTTRAFALELPYEGAEPADAIDSKLMAAYVKGLRIS